MEGDKNLKVTLCGLLNKIADKSGDDEIRVMVEEATLIAKKMDAKLRMYSRQAKNAAHDLQADNWQ